MKVDYKKYHIFHLIAFLGLGLIISQCRSVYTIYLFTLISGTLSGIKYSTITKMNTQNKEYEPYCFIEEERSQVIGGTLGLLVSQFIYDISPKIYLLGYVVLIVVGTILSMLLKRIPNEDVMEQISEDKVLDKKSKNETIIVTSLFAILVGFWCMGWNGFEELSPLVSDKIGYLNAVYTILEIILLCIVSGSILQKIHKKKKLLFTETVISCVDVFCLFIAAITLSWQGLLIAYIITAFTSTMGDPIWGSLMSAYSTNDREKWVLVNRVYFVIRALFTILAWLVCRECVIKLANVYIDEEYRNKGYARKLLENVKENAKHSINFNELFLYTRHVGLYEKFGFEYISDIDTYNEESRIERLYRLNLK